MSTQEQSPDAEFWQDMVGTDMEVMIEWQDMDMDMDMVEDSSAAVTTAVSIKI